VKDIVPGTGGSAPESLTDVNGTLFFVADDGSSGRELWTSDGTAAGTVRVKDIVPGTGGSAPESLTDVNGTLFFVADDGVSGRELWMSDGTEARTVVVADVVPGYRGSYPEQLTAVGSWLFFSAIGDDVGRELWRFCTGLPAECALPPPACQLLPGKRLVLKTKRGSAKGRIELVSTDSTISLGPGAPGGPDDPTRHGGSLRIVTTAGDRFDDTYPLPASRWRYRKPGTNRGYTFRPTKPFQSVTIRPGKRIRVAAHGVGLGHTLATDPTLVDVVLTIGAHCYCFHFDEAVVFKPGRKWVAKHAAAPSVCGALAE
jgi:ELWxxDGT repeat protein